MNTPTDIIRLIVAKNDGDISLTNNCKFKLPSILLNMAKNSLNA